MDEDKVIRPMDFVRLTSIDKSNVIKDTKNHIGLVKGQLLERTWNEVLNFINEAQNKPMDKRTEADELI